MGALVLVEPRKVTIRDRPREYPEEDRRAHRKLHEQSVQPTEQVEPFHRSCQSPLPDGCRLPIASIYRSVDTKPAFGHDEVSYNRIATDLSFTCSVSNMFRDRLPRPRQVTCAKLQLTCSSSTRVAQQQVIGSVIGLQLTCSPASNMCYGNLQSYQYKPLASLAVARDASGNVVRLY